MDERGKDYASSREKHLEMIQRVVDRMASSSAITKRYCLLVIAAAVGLLKFNGDGQLVLGAILLTFVFWTMDSNYLRQEKWFRDVFESVRVEASDVRPDYRITPDQTIREATSLASRMFRWSTAGFYGPLLLLLVVTCTWGK